LDDVHLATVILRESPESAWPSIVEQLKAHNARVLLLTGDGPKRAEQVLADEYHAALKPSDKQRLVADYQDRFGAVTFVGDGVNDAAAMSTAEGSVAIIGGSDLAGAVAQACLPASGLDALPEAVRISRSAQQVLRTNIAISITYNVIGIAVAAAGWLHPAFAAILMVASSVIVTARSLSVAEEHGTRPHQDARTEIDQLRLAPLPRLST
jgi:Cu+-exporting ATPase